MVPKHISRVGVIRTRPMYIYTNVYLHQCISTEERYDEREKHLSFYSKVNEHMFKNFLNMTESKKVSCLPSEFTTPASTGCGDLRGYTDPVGRMNP